jgi:hypothetical protein
MPVLTCVPAPQSRSWKETRKDVLLTVLFALVLFFGGIGGTSHRLRIMVFVITLVHFATTLIALGTMPIYKK